MASIMRDDRRVVRVDMWTPGEPIDWQPSAASTCDPNVSASLQEQLELYTHDLARFLVREPIEIIGPSICWYCGTRIRGDIDTCPGCNARNWDRAH